jgi:hypothetical protein
MAFPWLIARDLVLTYTTLAIFTREGANAKEIDASHV